MRYFIELSYDGTAYHGWQIQPNGSSVQETLQRALSLLLREEVTVTGAGRTDAGVHAAMMVAHVDIEAPLPAPPVGGRAAQPMSSSSSQEYQEDLPPVGGRAAQPMSSSSSQEYKEVLPPVGGRAAEPMSSSSSQEYKEVLPPTGGVREGPPERNLVYRLNGILPHDIAIHRIYPVADDMHARFSALARTYYYYVHTRKSPFLRDRSWRLVKTPDFEAMNRAAATLLEYEDFTSFSKVNTDTKTNICHVRSARWVQLSDYEWRFEITADRFLRNMVRAIVGTLMEVGRGQLSLDGFRKVIEDKNRSAAGDSVPARGLFLQNVEY